MVIAIALAVVAASFLVAFGLRVRTKAHWFTAWLSGALVLPVSMWLSELVYPSGWLAVALFFGSLVSAAVAALGVLFGRLIVRRRVEHAAF